MDPEDKELEKIKEEEEEIEELILLEHKFTTKEQKTLVQALKTFLNTALIPIQRPTKYAISALRRQKRVAQELLKALSDSYSEEMAVSKTEAHILKKALISFVRLPKPLWQDINQIKTIKDYQNTAVNLIDTFDIEE